MKWLAALLFIGLAMSGCVTEEPEVDDEPEVPIVENNLPSPLNVTKEQLDELGLAVDAQQLVANLKAYAETFPQRKANHADHDASREWLAQEYAAAGYDVLRHEFTMGIPQENICGIHWGLHEDQWIIVGGHYDMTDAPGPLPVIEQGISSGIYDDGSGTMMTLDMARAFAGVQMDKTVAFCGFDGEERGLQGSGALADFLTEGNTTVGNRTINVTIAGMLDLDMIGLNWPGVMAPIYFDDNSMALQNFTRRYAADLNMPSDMIEFRGISAGRSDYAHYFALGVPTGFMISDFEDWQMPGDVPADGPTGQYPFWHRADNWETMLLMAGSEEDIVSGFQMATDIAIGVLYFLSADAELVIDAIEK